ncbi:hypothetical protein [Natrialbaceae archaeon AArc-T1-2]|uniref:hypothetical protein n=1 Tax=Natrialbaceae archaeon AArc-T1-2 TaxID=3053904 RepID=UPI00255A7785|nr:hypothetical protein [Natrialbaceae archaeon AArc-T1-2]WIV68442.1 hypothetical protein QQ977_06890 [Natrialbaceae archaeon AArc-T1-2]
MTFTCRVCGFESESPNGIVAHANKHKNRFRSLTGREPDDYDEVVDLFRSQPTLFAPFGDDQTTLVDHGGESG